MAVINLATDEIKIVRDRVSSSNEFFFFLSFVFFVYEHRRLYIMVYRTLLKKSLDKKSIDDQKFYWVAIATKWSVSLFHSIPSPSSYILGYIISVILSCNHVTHSWKFTCWLKNYRIAQNSNTKQLLCFFLIFVCDALAKVNYMISVMSVPFWTHTNKTTKKKASHFLSRGLLFSDSFWCNKQ